MIHLYSEQQSSDFFDSRYSEIKNKISSETEDFILNVGDIQYVEHLKNIYQVNFPIIHTEDAYVDSYEKEIQGRNFPSGFFIEPTKYYKKDVVAYYIPYEGNINLLKFRPNSWNSMIGFQIETDNKSEAIKLEIVNFYDDPKKIERDRKSVV